MRAAALNSVTLRSVALVRIAGARADGLPIGVVSDDLFPLVAPVVGQGEWRRHLTEAVASAVRDGLIEGDGKMLAANGAGRKAAAAYLGIDPLEIGPWPELRDIRLIAKTLGIEKESAVKLKGLANAERLRARILVSAFSLSFKGVPTPARLRNALAVVALDRAFGNQLKSRLGSGQGLSGKAGRLLAGQLSRAPRDFGTDRRLIAELAAEQVGANGTDLAALRRAILLRLLTVPVAHEGEPASAPKAKPVEHTITPRTATPKGRPDLKTFASEVLTLARPTAEGWAGDRKALISRVWRSVRVERPSWALSEIEFKCMLTEAHRVGHITLANADLKDKQLLPELQASAIAYKNVVWHYIRILN